MASVRQLTTTIQPPVPAPIDGAVRPRTTAGLGACALHLPLSAVGSSGSFSTARRSPQLVRYDLAGGEGLPLRIHNHN